MEVNEVLEDFYEIFTDLKSRRDELDHQSCILASTAILQELGKYRRTKILRDFGNVNNDELATEKQKAALKKFGIEFRDRVTKQEASALLTEAIEKNRSSYIVTDYTGRALGSP